MGCGCSCRPSWAPVRFYLWLFIRFVDWILVALPAFVLRWVPHSKAILSMGFLYVFAQALGILWLLHINLLSNFSVVLVEFIETQLAAEVFVSSDTVRRVLAGYVLYCLMRILFFIGTSLYTIGWEAFSDFPAVRQLVATRSSNVNGTPAAEHHGMTGKTPSTPPRGPSVLSRPMRTRSSSTPSFEVLDDHEDDFARQSSTDYAVDEHDTPPREPTSEGDRSPNSPQNSPAAEPTSFMLAREARERPWRRSRRRRFRREATLLAPLMGLMACTITLGFVSVTCHLEVLHCETSDFVNSLTNPTGRLNRGIRFSLFIAFLQWLQQFVYLFPDWHRGLLASRLGRLWSLVAMPLLPIALIRLGLWSVMPAGTGITQHLLGKLPHHAVDTGLILALKTWMLVSCFLVLQNPELSGMQWRRLSEEDEWHEMTALFKYSFLMPMLLHFARGIMKFGFAGAQNDLIVVVCAYPLLLTAVWTVVWAVVVAPRKRTLLAGMAGSSAVAWVVCLHGGSYNKVAALLVVWLHLMRQFLKLFGNTQVKPTTAARSAADTATPSTGFAKRSNGSARRPSGEAATVPVAHLPAAHLPTESWGKVVIGISFAIGALFFSVLVGLAIVASLQKSVDWYPKTMWFQLETDPPALRVDHMISRLRLQVANSSSTTATAPPTIGGIGGVSYATCNHLWHGISLLDFSLLSLAAYFDRSDPSLPELLNGIYPEHTGITWRLRNTSNHESIPPERLGSRLSWIEIEITQPGVEKPLLVVSVRGTDPTRVSDYVEDIRMWTEPVALSILSTIFPTVRAWPRRTVEMVIQGIHDFMGSLGIAADRWSYSELVRSLEDINQDDYERIVLTGHSLGGGMATIAATLLHLPVIAITPPGIYMSIAKHHRTQDKEEASGENSDLSSWMHHQSLTLRVENDWVNGIFDDHGGLVQMMMCDRSHQSLQLACHMLEGTICHIYKRCGDPLGRWYDCAHNFLMEGEVRSTAERMIREKLPDDVERRLEDWSAWLQQLSLPFWHDTRSNYATLAMFFVVGLPLLGGAIEELFLL